MFRWRQVAAACEQPGAGVDPSVPEERPCPGMARALERILQDGRQPEILDLGSLCGPTAVFLANRGARVSVGEFEPPVPFPEPAPGTAADEVEPPPLRIDAETDRYDLVLAWEHWDFVPPERIAEFAAELRRVLAPGGLLLFYSQDNPAWDTARRERPGSYRVTADDRIVRNDAPVEPRPRWGHPHRAIEQALQPLSVQSVHRQPNRLREFLALNKAP